MNAAWIGIIIGLVMGLTGSGGALVAIPLFQDFLNMSLKEATSFSLVAVSLSALFNMLMQWENIDFKLSFWIIPFSILSSFFFVPVKEMISEWLIFSMLVFVSLIGILSVWWPLKKIDEESQDSSLRSLWGALLGIVLGILTTLTGLGGGVLIMPALILIFRFSHSRAVATSFLPILLTSLSAFLFQWKAGFIPPSQDVFLSLSASIAVIALSIPFLIQKLSPLAIMRIRKISFTIVVLLSLLKILGALV